MGLRKNKRINREQFTAKKIVHDDGEGNWLISYADLMTLLWGFFVIISAFSTPDPSKFEKLKQKTSESMGGEYTDPYKEVVQALINSLEKLQVDQDGIKIETLSDGVRITAESAKFFDSGSALLKEDALKIVEAVGLVLLGDAKDYITIVEGHTDDQPISTRIFPSNWELSTRRATEVVRLFEGQGIPSKNLRPIGLADVDPIAKIDGLDGNDLREARNKNRRIIIKLQKQLPARTSQ